MALRLVEVICRAGSGDLVERVLTSHDLLEHWRETIDDDRLRFRLLMSAEEAEAVLDELDRLLGASDLDFRATLLPVEATIPRLEEQPDSGKKTKRRPERVSREEMYERLRAGAQADLPFLAFVVLSVVVAAIGLIRNDTAVLIGAMVIAPLLTPNMSLALGTTLGDGSLIWKSLRVNIIGVTLAFGLAVATGVLMKTSPDSPAIQSRANVELADVVLALAAGAAGAMAMTTTAPSSLIGVMVAVALMPPLVASGLLAAGGYYHQAFMAMELVAINVISVNLAGVVTFVIQGVGPRTYWETERARRAVVRAIAIWVTLLGVLIFLIVRST